MKNFDYRLAFSRNIGWLTEAEQQQLSNARVAIAGLGGVGGSHLLTLTRLGVGRFNLADFDSFAVENFNRQTGANLNTVGKPKLDTMIDAALAINPLLDIKPFPEGVKADQAEAFLQGCDLYLDGLDFFAMTARRAVFAACHEMGLPAVTAAPLGMGS
ncbi:MAG: ThiF family adenylyltransferase, partial [Candidatus Thiodiazotropha taylori]